MERNYIDKQIKERLCAKEDLIDDTRYFRTHFRIDGIKMSRGILRGKQVFNFANTSNRGRVCLFSQNNTTI